MLHACVGGVHVIRALVDICPHDVESVAFEKTMRSNFEWEFIVNGHCTQH